MGLSEELQNNEKTKRDLFRNFKPTDCKRCYVASAGVMGMHYSCGCEKSKMYNCYPLIMCPKNCEFYEKEEEE